MQVTHPHLSPSFQHVSPPLQAHPLPAMPLLPPLNPLGSATCALPPALSNRLLGSFLLFSSIACHKPSFSTEAPSTLAPPLSQLPVQAISAFVCCCFFEYCSLPLSASPIAVILLPSICSSAPLLLSSFRFASLSFLSHLRILIPNFAFSLSRLVLLSRADELF